MSKPATGSVGATVTTIKSSQGKIMGWYIFNGSNAVAYAQLFDAATAAGVTLGTTPPTMSIGIASGQVGFLPLGQYGFDFLNGIQVAFTTTRAGSAAPNVTIDYNFAIDLP